LLVDSGGRPAGAESLVDVEPLGDELRVDVLEQAALEGRLQVGLRNAAEAVVVEDAGVAGERPVRFHFGCGRGRRGRRRLGLGAERGEGEDRQEEQ